MTLAPMRISKLLEDGLRLVALGHDQETCPLTIDTDLPMRLIQVL